MTSAKMRGKDKHPSSKGMASSENSTISGLMSTCSTMACRAQPALLELVRLASGTVVVGYSNSLLFLLC